MMGSALAMVISHINFYTDLYLQPHQVSRFQAEELVGFRFDLNLPLARPIFELLASWSNEVQSF